MRRSIAPDKHDAVELVYLVAGPAMAALRLAVGEPAGAPTDTPPAPERRECRLGGARASESEKMNAWRAWRERS